MHSLEKHLLSGFCALGLKDGGIDTAPSALSSQSRVGGGISSDVIAQGDTMVVCPRGNGTSREGMAVSLWGNQESLAWRVHRLMLMDWPGRTFQGECIACSKTQRWACENSLIQESTNPSRLLEPELGVCMCSCWVCGSHKRCWARVAHPGPEAPTAQG